MNKTLFFVAVLALTCVLSLNLFAQNEIRTSVVSNGSTPTGNASFRIRGTVGQGAIGISTNDAHAIQSGYWVQTIDLVTSVERGPGVNIPAKFELRQNYPNPFNPTTTISYSIPTSASGKNVKLELYNTLGQKVGTLVDEKQDAGFYAIRWDGRNDFGMQVSSGLYLYRLVAGSFVQIKKMVLVR